MSKSEIRKSVRQSLGTLKKAEHELNRPKEDVVTISVCFNIRQSMNTMMRLFLLDRGIMAPVGLSLKDLLQMCIQLDRKFSFVDITPILCSGFPHKECDGRYCMETEHVEACIKVGNNLKEVVVEKLEINEDNE